MNRPIRGPKPNPENNPNLSDPKHDKPNDEKELKNERTEESLERDSEMNMGLEDGNSFYDDLHFPIDVSEDPDSPDDDLFSSVDSQQPFIDDDGPKPPPLPHLQEQRDTIEEYQYEYDPNRSYLFIFGPSSAGKTVLIGSIIKYLKTYRSQTHGDTLQNRNRPEIKHEFEGNRLWRNLTEANIQNTFPKGTQRLEASRALLNLPVPRHINLHFRPASKLPDFEFCFMDLSGEDCNSIDYEDEGQLHWSIRTYLEDVPKNNMCFVYVVDPKCEESSCEEQTALFEAFIDTLDANEHTSTPLLILVSKWDLFKGNYSSVELYLKSEFQDIWGVANQAMRNITVAEFSIGNVETERNQRIITFDPSYPERIFNWFYKTQTNHSLLEENAPSPPLNLWSKLLGLFRK